MSNGTKRILDNPKHNTTCNNLILKVFTIIDCVGNHIKVKKTHQRPGIKTIGMNTNDEEIQVHSRSVFSFCDLISCASF